MNGMRLSTTLISETRLLSIRYLQPRDAKDACHSRNCGRAAASSHLTRLRPIVPIPPAISHRGLVDAGAAILNLEGAR